MLKVLQWLGLSLAALICALALGSSTPVGSQTPPPDYFPLPVEATWKYKSVSSTGFESEFDQTVLAAEQQADGSTWYKLEIQSQFPILTWYSKSEGWAIAHREQTSAYEGDFEPPKRLLKNPASVGDTWEWSGMRPGAAPIQASETSEVVGTEAVTVPAGTFQALKVETAIEQGGTALSKTAWYASGVGAVKLTIGSDSFESTTELIDYTFP